MSWLSASRGRVLAITAERPGMTRLEVEVDGATATAVAFHAFGPAPAVGDEVMLNTTAVELGLGTGGVHLVIPGAEAERSQTPGHAMKLRYTPLQIAPGAVEEAGGEPADLGGAPVVAMGLHSALVPAALGVRSVAPSARIAYVMTDAAALPLAFSDTVAAAKACGLIDVTVTAGQAFGGEIEAVNLYSALCAAAARADIVLCGMGPGNLGTGSALGFAGLEVGEVVNAAAALGGRPVVVPRISFADPRERHRGVSHHTLTALRLVALAPAEVALPPMEPARHAAVHDALRPACEERGHTLVDVPVDTTVLDAPPVPITSMGRSVSDDPEHFLAGAAGGALAARTP